MKQHQQEEDAPKTARYVKTVRDPLTKRTKKWISCSSDKSMGHEVELIYFKIKNKQTNPPLKIDITN